MSNSRRRAPRVLVPFARTVQAALAAGVLFSAACAGPTPRAGSSASTAPSAVAAAVTLAPPPADPEVEIVDLTPYRTAPALLRTAWLELSQRRPDRAIDATNAVLYGLSKPSPNEESFARYLRAEAYEQQGRPERGKLDRERAAAIAIDPELRRLLAADAPRAAESAPVASPALAVQPRSAWQARAADRGNIEPMGKVTRVTIHHSAMYFRDTRPTTCGTQIQLIQRDHMQNRGYGDIGYHFLIDPSGRIWQGRELRWQGAHASGANNIGNVGICLLGNFMRGRGGQGPTNAQKAAMRRLVGDVMAHYRFGPDSIYCHSDFKVTECPGELMEPVVAQMVRDLRSGAGERLADAAEQ